MASDQDDGSAGDADYARIGFGYTRCRRPKPRFSVAVPLIYSDGFAEAYYGRPELLLDPRARLACSAWSFVEAASLSVLSKRSTAT